MHHNRFSAQPCHTFYLENKPHSSFTCQETLAQDKLLCGITLSFKSPGLSTGTGNPARKEMLPLLANPAGGNTGYLHPRHGLGPAQALLSTRTTCVPLLDTHVAGPLLPACWLHLPQLSSAVLSSMLLLGLSCFKMHQARSCRDLHLALSSAVPFCITGCDYCRKSRTISPGTHGLQSWGSLCSPLLQERVSPTGIIKHGSVCFLPMRPACPRHVLGMEDAYVNTRPREGSHAGDPLLALDTNTEIKRKTNSLQEGKAVKLSMSCWSQGR